MTEYSYNGRAQKMNRHLIQNGNGEKNIKSTTAANAIIRLMIGKISGESTIDLPIYRIRNHKTG
jgi:hypothetical protein